MFQGKAVYSKDLGDGMPYKVVCWYDKEEGAWVITSSKVIQFSSGWSTKQLAKAVPKNYLYDFMNMDWEVLWPEMPCVQVLMVPLSVVQKLSEAAAGAAGAGSSSDGAGDVWLLLASPLVDNLTWLLSDSTNSLSYRKLFHVNWYGPGLSLKHSC